MSGLTVRNQFTGVDGIKSFGEGGVDYSMISIYHLFCRFFPKNLSVQCGICVSMV